MNLKSIISKCFGNVFSNADVPKQVPENVQADSLILAGTTDLGMLYVDVDKTGIVQKEGQYYLTVYAKEKYTDRIFLRTLRKEKELKNVVAAVYLYLFDNNGSSYCTAANYLVDEQGKVCLDCGKDMQMKALTVDDTTMMNAYTICLKALELKQNENND